VRHLLISDIISDERIRAEEAPQERSDLISNISNKTVLTTLKEGEDMNEDKIKVILDLIADELGAIDGYTDALNYFNSDDEVSAKLKEIRADEEDHIKELSQIMFKIK